MAKQVKAYRLSDMTIYQLEQLTQQWGTSQTETLSVIVDRIYQQEIIMSTHSKIEQGCEVNYGVSLTASAGKFRNNDGDIRFGISYQQGEMPAFSRKEFATESELIEAMRNVAPLTKWRISRDD